MAMKNLSIFNQCSASALIKISIILTFLIRMSTSIIGKDLYTHKENATIQLAVGSLNSIKTQIPFDYYYLDICPPEKLVLEPDNLGEILTGDRSYYSKYQFKIGQNEYCQELCVKKINTVDVNLFKWMINRNYTVNWYADKLPAGLKFENEEKVDVHYLSGVPIGYQEKAIEDVDTIIYNHLTFTIQIHKEQAGKGITENLYTIVGFNIQPFSIHQNGETGKKCSPDKENFNKNFRTEKQKVDVGEILFTYDVIFEMSNLTFSSRWDHYLHIHNDSIHWFSLINSSLIIVIFSFIVLHIFMRALKKDIEIYNSRVSGDEFIDEFGWKQVCNDVFRRPANRMLFSTLIGTGVQLFSMSAYSLLFASLGFLNPEKRGALLMIMILLFVFMGVFAGYYSTRFYKMFQGKDWLKNAFLTAFLYPALAFSVFFVINFMFWLEGSSAAVRFLYINYI
jgi:transmembrane 9 superfamily protein 2/4